MDGTVSENAQPVQVTATTNMAVSDDVNVTLDFVSGTAGKFNIII